MGQKIKFCDTAFDLGSSSVFLAIVVKNLLANAGDTETQVRSWGWESLQEGNYDSLQYSYLETPMDREVWQTMVHGVTRS